MRWFVGVLMSLLITLPAASAVDYGKVDRTITKQPKYASKSPQYALLLFGPRAVRVWVVQDGETVYVDRNGDGDLTGKDERFAKREDCKNIEIADPDGKTRYVLTHLSSYTEEKPAKLHLMANVEIKGPLNYHQYCDAGMTDSPKTAPIAHFHGPLSMHPPTINWKVPPGLALLRGEKGVDWRGSVGTLDARFGCWVVVRSHHGEKPAFGEGIRPVVEVEFPAKQPGKPAIKRRYTLDKVC